VALLEKHVDIIAKISAIKAEMDALDKHLDSLEKEKSAMQAELDIHRNEHSAAAAEVELLKREMAALKASHTFLRVLGFENATLMSV
jgi:predicted  nucleic acid-binding Zn-ribbon protein